MHQKEPMLPRCSDCFRVVRLLIPGTVLCPSCAKQFLSQAEIDRRLKLVESDAIAEEDEELEEDLEPVNTVVGDLAPLLKAIAYLEEHDIKLSYGAVVRHAGRKPWTTQFFLKGNRHHKDFKPVIEAYNAAKKRQSALNVRKVTCSPEREQQLLEAIATLAEKGKYFQKQDVYKLCGMSGKSNYLTYQDRLKEAYDRAIALLSARPDACPKQP